MKKIFVLCLFVFTVVLGTETVMAQTATEINTEVAKKTEELRKHVNLNKDQLDPVYNALKEYAQSNANLKNVTKEKTEVTVAKIEKQLEKKMKAILSEEQFERYMTYSQQE